MRGEFWKATIDFLYYNIMLTKFEDEMNYNSVL